MKTPRSPHKDDAAYYNCLPGIAFQRLRSCEAKRSTPSAVTHKQHTAVMLRRAAHHVWIARRPLATRQALLLKDAVLKGRTERAGAVVTVAGGHLRNYLYPRGVAVPATPENLARYEDLAASEAPAPAEAPAKPRAPTVTPSARTEYLEGGVRSDVAE